MLFRTKTLFQFNEMANLLKKEDGQGFIVAVYEGKEEHDPPHCHVKSTSGETLITNGTICRIKIPRHTYEDIIDTKDLTYEDIVPYRCEMTITMRKRLAEALNYKRKSALKPIWIKMIEYWNTFHPEKRFLRK